MKVNKTLLIVAFLMAKSTVLAQIDYPIKFTGFDPVIKEILIKQLDSKLVHYVNFKVTDDIGYTGGISVIYGTGFPECFTYRKTGAYNVDLEPIKIMQITIDKDCIESYGGYNKVNALVNAVNHEVRCHGITNGAGHLSVKPNQPKPLCSSTLSTDKIYWTKRDFNWVKMNLQEI